MSLLTNNAAGTLLRAAELHYTEPDRDLDDDLDDLAPDTAALPTPEPEPGTLPPLDYMRGYLARAHSSGALLDGEARRWLDALIIEVEHLRGIVADAAIPPEAARAVAGIEALTPAEVRVYRYLRNTHMTYAEIAAALYVSINTVKSHGKGIFAKLGITKRRHLRDFPNV